MNHATLPSSNNPNSNLNYFSSIPRPSKSDGVIQLPLTVPSPAKLNLFLHINGRLPNGYHELQSLFHFLDFGDEMKFEASSANKHSFGCSNPELETEDNLVTKARDAIILEAQNQNRTEHIFPTHIYLEKRLPMGGGVGGGSSNAATTLLALNEIWQLHFNLNELEAIGLKIGADVPIFVRGITSIADGVGEKLSDYPIDERWYLVLTPAAHVNTGQLFNSPDLPRDTSKIPLAEINYQAIDEQFKNDFQNLVVKGYPNVAKALNWLLEYGPARMTGTGACVFAEFCSQSEANEIFRRLPVELTGFVAKGCNISPTHQTLFGQ